MTVQFLDLSDEVIEKIFIMSSFNDIMKLSSTSKRIRNIFFKTSRIMQKVRINTAIMFSEWPIASKYMRYRGKLIKNLQFGVTEESKLLFEFILRKTPNLEELIINNGKSTSRPYNLRNQNEHEEQNPAKKFKLLGRYLIGLPKLKALEIELENLKQFTENVNNYDCLKKVSVNSKSFEQFDLLVEFLNQLECLKELVLSQNKKPNIAKFSTKNSNVKFQLQKLTINFICPGDYGHLGQFLETQADCLEELEFLELQEPEILQILTKKFKNLIKLKIHNPKSNKFISLESMEPGKLDSLTHLEIDHEVDLNQLIQIFPNIRHLKVKMLTGNGGNCENLENLELKYLELDNLTAVNFPNLKNLSISKNIENLSEMDTLELLKNFIKNVENVENFTVKLAIDRYNILERDFFKSLKIFKNLRKFSFRHEIYGTLSDEHVEENEEISEEKRYVKVIIDADKKTIKVSNYIVNRSKEILIDLHDAFPDFQFIEFCFEEIKEQPFDYDGIMKKTGRTGMVYQITKEGYFV